MVRWLVADLLEKRGWTAYRLAKEAGVTMPVAYRIAERGALVQRIEGRTLDAMCKALDVQPGELLEYVPEKPKRRK